MQLNPQIIAQGGKEEFIVLPVDEYRTLIAMVEDYEDLCDLRTAKQCSQNEKSVPLDQVMRELGL